MRRLLVVVLVVGLVLVASVAALGQAGGEASPVVSVPVTLADGSVITVTVVIDEGGPVADVAVEARSPVTYTLEQTEVIVTALDDLPYGFISDGENPTPGSANESLAAGFVDPDAMLAHLEEVGRQGGSYSTWGNTSWSMFGGGNAAIVSSALIFDSPAGALAYLESAMSREMERVNAPISVEEVSAPSLGDGSVAFASEYEDEDGNYTNLSVWVQLDNLVVVTEGRGFTMAGDFGQLLDVVEKMMAKAGR